MQTTNVEPTSPSSPQNSSSVLSSSGIDQTQLFKFVGGLAVLAIAGGGIYSAVKSRHVSQAEKANNALYQAKKSVEKDLLAFGATVPEIKTEMEKAPKEVAKIQAVMEKLSTGTIAIDVPVVYSQSFKALQKVAEDFPGTRAAFESLMGIADLYTQAQKPADAAPWYEKAIKSAPGRMDEAMAWIGLGYAYENSKKYKEAVDAFERSILKGDPVVKGDVLLAIARCHELSKDTAKAKSTYDKILTDLPNTEYAKSAEYFKKQL